ncbi:MAG: hypothetical protein ABIN57_07680 [Chitinophagaceae bacterium]
MTLKHFKALSQSSQRAFTLDIGIFLADRHTEDFTIILYSLNGFYVELYYHNDTNEVGWVKSFNSTAELDPYLLDIDVSILVSS